MRPEYIEAVKAVGNGWSFWIIFILPAPIIWFTMLIRPFRPLRFRVLLVCIGFLLACFVFWYCASSHAFRIQAAKEANMQTEEEKDDVSRDTWRVFAPIFAIPRAFIYCTINLIAAGLLRLLLQHIHKIIKSKYDCSNQVQMG